MDDPLELEVTTAVEYSQPMALFDDVVSLVEFAVVMAD